MIPSAPDSQPHIAGPDTTDAQGDLAPQADLEERLAEAERRAAFAMARAGDLQAELARAAEWRRASLIAVAAVALLAILMFGIVAFKAIDAGAAPEDVDLREDRRTTRVLVDPGF